MRSIVILGSFMWASLAWSQNVGIGTTSPDTTLHIVGKLKVEDGTQAEGLILASDSLGLASWTQLSARNVLGREPLFSDDLCLAIWGSLDFGIKAVSVAVQEELAFVVIDGLLDDDKFKVIDIQNPANPVEIAGLDAFSSPTDVEVQENLVCVTAEDSLFIIDVATPADPQIVASLSVWLGKDVQIQGNYAYVISEDDSLRIIDVSIPQNPVLASSYGVVVKAHALDVEGNYAYVGSFFPEPMEIIDISNPANPMLIGSIPVGDRSTSISVQGDFAYVTDYFDGGLQIIDVSEPSSPVLMGTTLVGVGPIDVAVQGDFAYVVHEASNDLRVVDISNPGAPAVVGEIGIGADPQAIDVQDNFAYIVDDHSLDLKVIQLFCMPGVVIDPLNGKLLEEPPANSAIWKQSGSDISNLNSGNVGIGLDLPVSKLHIVGDVRADRGSTTGSVSRRFILGGARSGPGNAFAYIDFQNLDTDGTNVDYVGARLESQNASGTNSGDLRFYTRDGSLAPKMIITHVGNVGIGILSPDAALHVSGGDQLIDRGSSTSSLTRSLTIGGARSVTGNPFAQINFQNLDSNGANMDYIGARISSENAWDLNDGDLRFYTAVNGVLAPRITITPNGDVGIGTQEPSNKFAVVGSVDITGSLNLTGIMNSGGNIIAHRSGSTSGLTRSLTLGGARFAAGNSFAQIDFQNLDSDGANADYIGARISSENNGATDDGDLRFYTTINSALTQRMTIDHNGNVGIGTTSPNRKLHIFKGSSGAVATSGSVAVFEDDASAYISIITGNSNERGLLFGEPSNNAAGAIVYNNPSNPDGIQFRTGGNITRMVVTGSGNVGIGTTNPGAKLQVNGDICYTGSSSSCSDSRYKKVESPVENVMHKIESLKGLYYTWKQDEYPDKNFPDGVQLGVIAQDVQEVFPELVLEDKDGYLSVDYARLSVVLLEGVKEQQEVIQGLEAQLASLHDRMAALEEGRQGKTSP